MAVPIGEARAEIKPGMAARMAKAKSLSDLVRPALAEALRKQGFASVDILRHWPDIAGARLGQHSLPVRLKWPPRPQGAPPDRPPEPATLILRVEGPFALEVEMAVAQIIERVNAVFGWRCVGRLRLQQGPLDRPAPRRRPPPAGREPPAAALAPLGRIEDEGLRASLERLGRAVAGAAAGARREPNRTGPLDRPRGAADEEG